MKFIVNVGTDENYLKCTCICNARVTPLTNINFEMWYLYTNWILHPTGFGHRVRQMHLIFQHDDDSRSNWKPCLWLLGCRKVRMYAKDAKERKNLSICKSDGENRKPWSQAPSDIEQAESTSHTDAGMSEVNNFVERMKTGRVALIHRKRNDRSW